ncbi:CRISPR-associated endonuclease Cas1 [Methylocaldum marinum]|uniref:CRISPR-associated endonuclease Cas1 n=1 Tax=Methylocaldum marinum TaxID=1432792 RepID=A0A250L0X8_9GAMM|nr:CRISPR-associated endonuclease Cas1 [Methylocaldum marinum]BBA37446.1 CRISPR-associated endonuclease Cas1 [Methylocaldum marinum]
MGTLYLDRKDIELRREGRHLCLYEAGSRSATIPLNVIERVVVRGQATLSTGVLGLLAEEGIGLLVLSGRQGRTAAILHGTGHGDTARRIAQYRWHHDDDFRLPWARRLVALKLKAQARLLRSALPVRPDCRKPLTDGIARLERALASIEGSQRLERLQGIEGAAAAAYFAAYTQLFPAGLGFTGRNRRPPKDPVNAALSLTYTLLHFEAVNACHAAGLDPYVGFFHEPAYYRESLAADLIEPLRPRADRWVWRLFADRALRGDSFATEADRCLLKKNGREIFYGRYECFARPLRALLRRYSLLIARRLTGEAP